MTYGRLDIFWPNGNFESYQLTDPNTSVGRSEGNMIALENETVSRYHFSITHDAEGNMLITDLASDNGTFVDGVRLSAEQPKPLQGGEEIQAGHLRMIYYLPDDSPTSPVTTAENEEETQRFKREGADFYVEVYGPEIAIAPGAHISAELFITNNASTEQGYIVEASGIPKEWLRIDRPRLIVDPNDSAQVLINFKPLRVSETKPGDYTINITVKPQDKPEMVLEARVTLRVLPFGGFGAALEHHTIDHDERFRLHLHNQGSAPLPLKISGVSKAARLQFHIQPEEVTLAPGQRLLVQGSVSSPRRPLVGETREHSFDLLTRSRMPSGFVIATRGYVIEKALMPTWMAISAAGIGFSVLLLLLVGLLALLNPAAPQPSITDFTLSASQVARGTDVQINWVTQDATRVSVFVDNSVLGEDITPAERGSLLLPTSNLSGDVRITLIAINGEERTSTERTLVVYDPLNIAGFSVSSAQLVRYTVQTLTLDWQVSGASSVRIDGLSDFTSDPVSSTVNAEGSLEITGVLTDARMVALAVTLTAENAFGERQEQVLQIPIVDPQCAAVQGNITLHEGPGFQYRVVGAIPTAGDTFITDGRTQRSDWLRLRLSGEVNGWAPARLLSCVDSFNLADLRVVLPDVPQEEPATATPQAAPPATTTPAG